MNAEQATSMIARNRFPLLPHCGNKREREAETAPSTILKRRGYAFDFTVGFKLKGLKKEQIPLQLLFQRTSCSMLPKSRNARRGAFRLPQ